MNEQLKDKINYFTAWVRLHSDSDLNRWSLQDLIDSFLMLPTPHISFVDWLAARNINPSKPELTDKEKVDANEDFITALKANKPEYVQINEDLK